jgi:predicted transcriptional regulator
MAEEQRTKKLFLEFLSAWDKAEPEAIKFTMSNKDVYSQDLGRVVPSIIRLYVEVNDPTDYSFVKQHLVSWKQWDRLCACKWFKDTLREMRSELAAAIKSKAVVKIRDLAEQEDSKHYYQANKFLNDHGWNVFVPKETEEEKKAKNSRGRPTKEFKLKPDSQDVLNEFLKTIENHEPQAKLSKYEFKQRPN